MGPFEIIPLKAIMLKTIPTRFLLFSSLFLVLSIGCGGCDEQTQPPSKDAADTGKDSSPDSDVTKVICEPDTIVRCPSENTAAIEKCSPDGTKTFQASCPTVNGPAVCRDKECVSVTCIPNQKRCLEDGEREQCNPQGTAWQALDSCSGSARCEAGNCLDRCQIADLNRSYIGCEYWAVELDNALLNEEGELGPDEEPPYAIVLANTATDYDALVTIFSDTGEIAQADASRLVGSDVQFPGVELVTVKSQLVDQNGVKLLDVSGPVKNIPLPRQSILTIILPTRRLPFKESSLSKSAYRVLSSQPIVAYQFNPLCCNYNFTNDASLLLPKSALTNDYMHMGYEVWRPRFGDTSYSATMTVTATEPDTRVTVTLRPSTKGASFPDILYPNSSARINGPNEQGVITATLQPHEVLNLGARARDHDLTGARISSTKPISVFGGHTCAFVPDGNAACDHLESQLFPLETWGRRFFAAPLKIRGNVAETTLEGTYFKFLALENQTEISTGINLDYRQDVNVLRQTSGAVKACLDFSSDPAGGKFTLDAGQSCVIGSKKLFVAESGKPLMVGAFLSGQGSVEDNPVFGSHAGDPAFFLVPPEEQFRSEYSFLTPPTYFVSYITVVMQPGFSIFLDGVELNLTDFDYENLEDTGIARAHIAVEPGPHFITSQNQIPFGLIVYGYDDFVSYAYTGGLNLTKLNEL